ncbi:c-type cytochrome [Candidatus Thioglobus autotrophicus]|nr:cytochrome c [Candidatus Thioglobus autotrophicus]
MMKDTIIKSTLLVATLALGSYAQAAPSGQALGYTCAGCHGTNGASTGNAIPSIAGLSETYMVETMNAYKSGDKASTIMGRIAKGYSEEDIENMAGFFAEQEVHKNTNQSFDAAKANAGQALHEKYCDKCHTEGGTVADDDAGQLSGNAKLFMQYSLADFHDGSRDMEKKMAKKMKRMMKKDSDAFDKLVNYYTSGQ